MAEAGELEDLEGSGREAAESLPHVFKTMHAMRLVRLSLSDSKIFLIDYLGVQQSISDSCKEASSPKAFGKEIGSCRRRRL